MTSWTRLTLPFSVVLLLAACNPIPDEVVSTSNADTSTSTSAGPGPTTPGTTMPGEDTVGTVGATGTSTTMGDPDTTVGVSVTDETTVDPSTSSSSESGSTGPVECEPPCGPNLICSPEGTCVDACGGTWGVGSYGYCLDGYGGFDTDDLCQPGNHTCIYWGEPIAEVACALQNCTSACDCPLPSSGNATVTCGQLTDAMTPNECYLSCAGGETCPDGMMCNGEDVCTSVVPAQEVYGNCNLAPGCDAGLYCASGDGGEEVCMSNCNSDDECPDAPPTGNAFVDCDYVATGNPGQECHLNCSGGLTCPDGMVCYNGYICLWP